MSKEEPFLFIGFRIHSNQSSTRCEDNSVFSFLLCPLDISAFVSLVANDVLQFHNWVFIQLG
jgi:hypothetical protein